MGAKEMFKYLEACEEAVSWVEGKSVREAWETSDRADWMLWLCGRMAGIGTWPSKSTLISFCESLPYKGSSLLEHTLASAAHGPDGDPDLAGHLAWFMFCLAKKAKVENKTSLEYELELLADVVREKIQIEVM
jgi:hypothetical protein